MRIEYLVIDRKGKIASTHETEASRNTWLFFVDPTGVKGYTVRDAKVVEE